MDGRTPVEWSEWGPEAFAVAQRSGRPVLLSLSVPWSPECVAMDETTFADPRIAAHVNDGFVPVRVDADRRPRVRDRYAMGAFPSTVFLTPAGEVITGATVLGPDGFRDILDAVRRRWDASGADAGSIPRALRESDPPGGTVSDDVERRLVAQLTGTFDEEFGGWGTDAKFPFPRTIEFALVRVREQATRTLEAVRAHLLDTYDGGFFRAATTRSWGGVRREKLLADNAALLRAFAHAYRYTGTDAYREVAERAVEYLTTTLWTTDGFAASQAGDDDHYRSGPADRETAGGPDVDRTVLAGANGLAVDALLWVAAYTDDDRPRGYARRARDTIAGMVTDDGAVVRFETDAGRGPTGLLADHAGVLAALTSSGSVLGERGSAEAVADHAIDRLQGESGAFRDGPVGGAGLLDRPLYPLDTNAELADALVDLWGLTGDDRYRRAAAEAVGAFADAADRMGVAVAGYATAAARLHRPRVVAVATPAGTDLHRAALRLADHETTVSPDDDRAPPGDAALLADGETVGTATDPESLAGLLTE